MTDRRGVCMQKAISILILGAITLSCLLCSCDLDSGHEETTDVNDEIIEAIDRSSPITDGNLITKTDTDEDGNINIKYFDNKDNLVEQYIWNDEKEVSHVVMTYSSTDKITKKEEISSDGQTNIVYSYQYDSDDVLQQTTISTFENGMMKKTCTYDNEDNQTSVSIYHYTDSNRLTKIERYDGENILQEYFEYEYNESGLTTKYSAYTASGQIKKYTTFEYNDASQLVKEKYFDAADSLQNYFVYEYHESGNTKSCTKYDADGSLISQSSFEDS